MTALGIRLRSIRLAADLSQEQLYHACGISQPHIAKIEAGKLNTSISNVGTLAELFGLRDQDMLDYHGDMPDGAVLRKNVSKYLRARGIDPRTFLRSQGATHILENKILPSKFLSSPKSAREICDHIKEQFGVSFSTTRISKLMDTLSKKGSVEKITTPAKRRFRYRKK